MTDLFDGEATFQSEKGGLLVVACGAVAREVLEVIRLNGFTHVTLECLPGKLHNTPQLIPDAVEKKVLEGRERFDQVFVAYADCGTGGLLDKKLDMLGVDRIPGDHCYQFFAGEQRFLDWHETEPATFYLTDFLCKHFERFVKQGLKLDRHPELLPQIFGNYKKLIYLQQVELPGLVEKAQEAAAYLGLTFELQKTGYGDLATSIELAARKVG